MEECDRSRGRGGESIYDTGEEELIQEDIKIGKTGSLRGLERGRKTGAAGLRVEGGKAGRLEIGGTCRTELECPKLGRPGMEWS